MSNYIYANNAESTLLNAVGPTDTHITVPGGQGARFPSPSGGATFLLTIEDVNGNIEIVECTGRATDTLTVVRGREGTLAQAFSASTGVYMRVTAGILNQVDWTKYAGLTSGLATLDATTKIPIAQFDTPLQVYGDNRWNLKLTYTPVQQGTGVGQLANIVKIGWSAGSKLKATVDATDLGNFALETWVTGTATALAATKLATARNIAVAGVVTGSANFDGTGNISIATAMPANAIAVSNVNGLQGTLNTFAVNNATNSANITWTGTVTAGAIVDNSDVRIKEDIEAMDFEDALAIILGTRVVRFFNTQTARPDFGVVADEQEDVTPELVFTGNDERKLKGVAYSRLAAPLIVVLQELHRRGII